jgi:peptidyl-prolyl cis-trans isomerase SurA
MFNKNMFSKYMLSKCMLSKFMFNKRTFNNVMRAAAVALLALGATLAHAAPAEIDKVVAIVDDDVVLKSEFDQRWVQIQQQIAANPQAAGQLPPENVLRKQVLDQIILEHLQLQMAQRAGVRVDDNDLNQALDTIAQQNNLSFEQFVQILQAQGLYQPTRDALRKEIMIGRFQSGAVNRRIEITRQEVENYLRSEAGSQAVAPEYHLAHILIPVEGAPSPQQSALVQRIHQELQNGADIHQIAAAGQINGIAVSGGDLGFIKVENLPSIFADVVPTLQSGEASEPFTSSSGYHIVQLLETRGGSALNIDQWKVRHILIKPNEVRTSAQAETLIRTLYQRIKNGADFADIARQNTDDPTSMVSGGELDWINDGMFPPDFMQKVHETPPGTMTEPFLASSGWHILQVEEHRVQDVTEDNKRAQAERILRNRKFDNELENWLTEIHDTSYIDIKMKF